VTNDRELGLLPSLFRRSGGGVSPVAEGGKGDSTISRTLQKKDEGAEQEQVNYEGVYHGRGVAGKEMVGGGEF